MYQAGSLRGDAHGSVPISSTGSGVPAATPMSRQNTNQRRQAMSDIEASVTKLLIATKQLLECLTQWSRLEATEKDVSDIYVNLGNEFNRATVSFQTAGIDMADLENTPNDLRNILERALGEEASVVSLDRFLPRIREIIINLLQGLKRKQQIHRMQSGEAAAPHRTRKTDSQGTQHSAGSIYHDSNGQRSMSPNDQQHRVISPTSATHAASSTNIYGQSPVKRNLPSVPTGAMVPGMMMPPPRRAPAPPSAARQEDFSPAPPIPTNSDPVVQLSQITLERRSSKRFSENYLAQLTSSPNADRHNKLSVDGVRKNLQKSVSIPEAIGDEDEESEEYSASRAYGSPPARVENGAAHAKSRLETVPSSQPESHQVIEASKAREHISEVQISAEDVEESIPEKVAKKVSIKVFVKHGSETKKIFVDNTPSLDSLRLSIAKVFPIDDEHLIYIEDITSGVAYALEDLEDIQQGVVLVIRKKEQAKSERQAEPTASGLATEEFRTWLEDRLTGLTSEIRELKTIPVLVPLESPASRSISQPEGVRKSPDRAAQNLGPSVVEQDLQRRLAEAEQTNLKLKEEIETLEAALAKPESSDTSQVVVSAHRGEVMSMSAKHEQRGTLLTAKLEEAMNTMERIRKDVLQRKVTPRPQQLADLTKEFEEIEKESTALSDNLVLLDSTSNKLWEEELELITMEQETLEYQRMFLDDIKADLEQSLSSLSTIKQVEEQKRVMPGGSAPVFVETAADPSRVLKFVQADIKSLHVNHERRAAAIEDAERQRVKEREYLMENEFEKELGTFVGAKSLKSTGGASGIERQRQEKDEALRKQWFSPPSTPQDGTVPANSEASPHKTSSSASVLARIDATKGTDILERRRSSMPVRHGSPFERLSSEEDREGRRSVSRTLHAEDPESEDEKVDRPPLAATVEDASDN